MKNEIYQRYLKKEIIRTKKNKLLEVKQPKGVFVARKTNDGRLLISMSILHKNDKFNLKEGLNAARRNATHKLGQEFCLSKDHAAAYDKFEQRAMRYFRFMPTAPIPDTENWTGKIVELGTSPVFYKVVEDDGSDKISVVYVGGQHTNPPQNVVFSHQRRNLFLPPNEKHN